MKFSFFFRNEKKAAGYNNIDVAQVLIESGADVNSIDRGGLIPLHNAASYGHIEIAQLLLDAGSQVNANDRWQFTPLHEGKGRDPSSENLETIKYFIKFLAAQKGRTQLCALLLSHGSNPFVKNQDGQTPFEVASQEDIRCLLRDAMIAESSDETVGTVPTMVQQEVEDSSEEKYSQLKKLVESIELGKYFEILRKEEITIDILGIVSDYFKDPTRENNSDKIFGSEFDLKL